MKVQQITRDVAKVLMNRMTTLLKPIEEEFGVSVQTRGGTFDTTYYKPKVEFTVVSAGGTIETPERRDYIALCELYGLKKEYLDKEFLFNGDPYVITGLKPRKKKFPIVAKNINNQKSYCFNESTVKLSIK